MQNFPLITNVARTLKPIILKDIWIIIRDLLCAAEYALIEKNEKYYVVFCASTHRSSVDFFDIEAIPAVQK